MHDPFFIIYFFAAEIHCAAPLALVSTSSRRVAIIASLLGRSHHLRAYHRGQLFIFAISPITNSLFAVFSCCCSLAPFQFSWCSCSSLENFLQKGHLYLSALKCGILLCFQWSPAAEGLGECSPVSWSITKIHLPAV